jgi:hypothetical protein
LALSVILLWASALLDIGRGWRSDLLARRELLSVAAGVSIASVIAISILGSTFAARISAAPDPVSECGRPAHAYVFSFGMEHSSEVFKGCATRTGSKAN